VEVYKELGEGRRRSLSVVFRYGGEPSSERTLEMRTPARARRDVAGVAFLGAGNYAKAVLLPALKGVANVEPVALVTATGASARRTAERFGFARCGTDAEAVLGDEAVDLVFVATQHDSHASLAERALRAGKAVWCEKPLAIDPEGLERVAAAARETGGLLAVGYNRRFSSHARKVREAFAGRRGPLAIHYRVSAGPPPRDSWITDPRVGGGRIVGEACHFVDLCTFLVGRAPRSVFARALGGDPQTDDSTIAVLAYPDGSTATIHYLARAASDLPKESFEVSGEGKTALCDNFRVTRLVGGARHKTVNQDKGQATAVSEVVAAVLEGGASPFDLDELVSTTRATFAIEQSLRSGAAVDLGEDA
jgi:predicted dehydrogenase